MWVDGILNMSHWEDSMKELAKEWEEYVFLVRFFIYDYGALRNLLPRPGHAAAEWKRGFSCDPDD